MFEYFKGVFPLPRHHTVADWWNVGTHSSDYLKGNKIVRGQEGDEGQLS